MLALSGLSPRVKIFPFSLSAQIPALIMSELLSPRFTTHLLMEELGTKSFVLGGQWG